MEDRQDEPIDDLLDRATEALRRSPTPPGPPPEALPGRWKLAGIARLSLNANKGISNMKRIIKIAVAASISWPWALLLSWITIGGRSTNIAFAAVAEALDNLRSATFDITLEAKNVNGQPPVTGAGKGFFLAPSRQRMESFDHGSPRASRAADDHDLRWPSGQGHHAHAQPEVRHGDGHEEDEERI